MLEVLIQNFKIDKKRNPSHVNELLDFTQKCYIQGELTISEYKQFFCELDKKNAQKPEAYFIKNKQFDTYNIPV